MIAAALSRGVSGTWMLLRGDATGLYLLDRSVDGFWRSFLVPLACVPLLALVDAAVAPAEAEGDVFFAGLVQGLTYIIVWPLVAIAVVRALDVGRNYVTFIVAGNWSTLLATGFLMPLTLAAGTGGPELAALLSVASLVFVLYLGWRIARLALEVDPPRAALVLAADFATSFGVARLLEPFLR